MTRSARTRAGFTMVEAAVSVLLVAVLLSAALTVATRAAMTEELTARRATGRLLAESLLAQIRTLPYEDDAEPDELGFESNETVPDDVDDYNEFTDYPRADGTLRAIVNSTADGWRRDVAVEWIEAGPISGAASNETGVKQITVSVYFNDRIVARISALRTRDE